MDGAKMTASELADLIGMCGDGGYNQDAATMLRQQQAEIEALKTVVYWLKENRPEVWDDIQKWRKYEPKR